MKLPDGPNHGVALGLIGIAVGIASVAIGLDQLQSSETVIWIVAGAAAMFLVAGLALLSVRSKRPPGLPKPNAKLAAECRRLANALDVFIDELAKVRLAAAVGAPDDAWQVEARRRYREELAPWAGRVFDAVLAAGAIVDCSRALVESPAPAQLHAVRGLFLDAALVLDPAHTASD